MTDVTAQDAAHGVDSAEHARRARKKEARTGGMVFAVLLMLLPVAPSTFAVVAVYMAPTWIISCFRAFHMPGAIMTVAALNFAGALPALYHLWTRGNDFEMAFALLFNFEYLGTCMAAAAIGLSLLWISPFIARTWVDIASQHLLHRAEAEREKLIDEWGEDLVAEMAEADKDDKN